MAESAHGPPPDSPIVRGEKVWLRGFTDDDLDPYTRFVMREDAQWAGYSLPTSRAKVHAMFEQRFQGEHGAGAFYFVVSPIGSNEFIGTTWLWNKDARIGGLELSIFMHDPQRWGTGLGTDAIDAALDYAFGFTDVDKIWLVTMSFNARAQRSFEKAGFSRDGMIRNYVRFRGEPVDGVLMSILRREWQQLARPRSWDRAGVSRP